MSWELTIRIIAIIFSAGLVFCFFIAPALQKPVPNMISEKDLVVAGYGLEGEKLYYDFREKAKSTSTENILKILIPLVIAVLPYVATKKNSKSP